MSDLIFNLKKEDICINNSNCEGKDCKKAHPSWCQLYCTKYLLGQPDENCKLIKGKHKNWSEMKSLAE
jgi:hypothetical protein